MESCALDDQIPYAGFRFLPSDEELILLYLRNQVSGGTPYPCLVSIPTADVYATAPRDLIEPGKTHAYYFCRLVHKNAKDHRIRRSVMGGGTWRPTGKAQKIRGPRGEQVGCKTLLTFYEDKKASGFVMHEYYLVDDRGRRCENEWVICRVKLSPHAGKEERNKKRNYDDCGVNERLASKRLHSACESMDDSAWMEEPTTTSPVSSTPTQMDAERRQPPVMVPPEDEQRRMDGLVAGEESPPGITIPLPEISIDQILQLTTVDVGKMAEELSALL